jgi:hypothetical protein
VGAELSSWLCHTRTEEAMATKPKENKQEQERPREASPEREKPADNADQAKEGMPGYGQAPEETRKPLPDQDW